MTSSLSDRSQYPCRRDSVYLNQASLGLIGQPAVAAMHSFLENVARHGNLYMSDSDEINYGLALRGVAGKLFHNDPSRIAILAGASEMLGQFPWLFRLKPNATILAVSSDFPAVTRPWVRQSYFEKIRVRFVDDLPDRDLTDAIINTVDETTGVIAVSSVQYATGTLVDVRRLAKSAQKVGAFLIVDATQAAGAMQVDTSTLEADAVVTSGYKWLGGHGGVALAAVSESLLKQPPILSGWMGAPDPFDFDAKSVSFASDARRFTQSTMCLMSRLPVLLFLSNSCCPWGRTGLKRMHVNWPRCWLMARANMAGNRFVTFMLWPHLLTSFRSDTTENVHGKPWRNSATR